MTEVTNPALADKNPLALEGMKLTLEAVDGVLAFLIGELDRKLDRNAVEADRIRERGLTGMDGSLVAGLAGSSIRWRAQREVLVGLRRGLPEAILEGRALSLALAIE